MLRCSEKNTIILKKQVREQTTLAKKRTYRKTEPEYKEARSEVTGNERHPPHASDLEVMILGAMLIDNEVINDVTQLLELDNFYISKHRTIFQAILQLDAEKKPIDPTTLKEELKRMDKLTEIGGVEYIMELTTSASTSANVKYYSRIIFEKAILRNLISVSSKIVENCLDPTSNTFKTLDDAEQKILDISQRLSKKKVISISEEIGNLVADLGNRRGNKAHVVGVPTGYNDLDEYTSGFQKSEFIVIAGRPSSGKTAFSMNIARNAAIDHNKSVAIFSLEMSFRELAMRLLSSEARVNSKKLKTGKTSSTEWQRVMNCFHKLKTNIYIDDTSELSILEIRAKSRKLKEEHDIDMVVVDYLQLIRGREDAERRDLEVAEVSRSLKALAKELDIPVVACAQLNRSVEQRGKEKRPQLADLRESGAIEQDADVVIFVHRPIMGMKMNKEDPEFLEMKHKAEIIIGKQRNGPVGDLELVFIDEFATFENRLKHPHIELLPQRGGEEEQPF